MTEEEKKFKIEKIEKYTKEYNKEEIKSIFWMFLGGLQFYLVLSLNNGELYAMIPESEVSADIFGMHITNGLAFLKIVKNVLCLATIYSLRSIFNNVSNMSILNGKIDELQDEIELDDIKQKIKK